MAEILYTYKNQVYANITNRCNCNCTFCVRSLKNAVGDAKTLWHQHEPALGEILKAINEFDFTNCSELVYCGYGEPTCALDNLLASAAYVKEKTRCCPPSKHQWIRQSLSWAQHYTRTRSSDRQRLHQFKRT